MDTLSQGHPIFELANIYITYVGFGEVNPKIVEDFLGLPYETAVKIGNTFIPLYLGTQDSDRIKEVEDKVKLLSYTRFLRHTVKRGGADTDEDKKTIAICSDSIHKLLELADSLEF